MVKKKSLFLIALLLLCPAAAKAGDAYNLTYDVYAGGIHTLQTRMRVETGAQAYHTKFEGETYGLLAKFVPWMGTFDTKGWMVNGGFRPEIHISDTVTKDKREINTFTYAKDSGFKSYSHVIDGKDETEDLDLSITKGTVDVLTAALQMMDRIAASGKCGGDTLIFDGERSYRLMFRDQGSEKLTANQYNFYAGDAVKCTAQVQPLGGKWHKKPRGWLRVQEQSLAKGMLPTLWMAKLSDATNAPYFPVKAFVKSNYGAFIVNITSFRDQDGQLRIVPKKP